MAAVIFQCAEMLAIMYDSLQPASLARTKDVLLSEMYQGNALFELRINDFMFHRDRLFREASSSEKKGWARVWELRDLRRFLRENRKFLEQGLLCCGINFDPLSGILFLYPVGGVIALALSEIVTVPFSRITMLYQVEGAAGGRRSILEQAARIMEEQGGGYKELWRGSGVTVAHRLAFYGISCCAYLHYRTLLTDKLSLPPAGVAFVSGGWAALAAASVTYPLEILSTRLATRTSKDDKGAWDTFLDMCSSNTFDSLRPEMLASLMHSVPFMAISCWLYESLRSSWRYLRPYDSAFTADFACGALASLAASTATFPFDVVKRRMQLEDANKGSERVGVRDVLEEIIQDGELYNGYQSHCLKVVTGLTIAFASYGIANLPFALFCAFDQWRSPRKNLFFTARDAVSSAISLQSALSREYELKVTFNEGSWFPWTVTVKFCPAGIIGSI